MPKKIAHRGIKSKNIKENSYMAIKNGLLSPEFIGVEFDVRCTKDNEFVIFHNPMYNNKLISDTNYSELPKYVPRLQDILKINSNKIFLVEIKNINNRYKELTKLLNSYKNKDIYVMSFSNSIIKHLNTSNRSYKIGVLNYVLNTSDLVQELDFVVILNSLINDDVIKIFKDKLIFSYGLLDTIKYDEVFYIVDSK